MTVLMETCKFLNRCKGNKLYKYATKATEIIISLPKYESPDNHFRIQRNMNFITVMIDPSS